MTFALLTICEKEGSIAVTLPKTALPALPVAQRKAVFRLWLDSQVFTPRRGIDMQDARSLLRFFTVVSPVILGSAFVSASSASTPTVAPIAQATPAATLAFTASNLAPVSGTSITLTATVTVTGASSTLGTFWIYDGTSTLVPGAMPNTTNGYAQAISTLAVGSHTLTAKYVGTANGLTATSAAVVVQVIPPKPTITSLSPALAVAGGPQFILTINGTNFVPGATAKWGTTSLARSEENTSE